MGAKLRNLLGSLRFWIVTGVAVVAVLESSEANNALVLGDLLEVVKVWLAAVVTIGTLDSVASKFGVALAKKE